MENDRLQMVKVETLNQCKRAARDSRKGLPRAHEGDTISGVDTWRQACRDSHERDSLA